MYIELILIENIVVNTILILIYIVFLNLKPKKKRIIFSTLFLSVINVIIKLKLNNSVIISILANFINIYILENEISFKDYIKRNVYFCTIYFLYIGLIFFEILLFNIDISKLITRVFIYILNGLILKFSNDVLWRMWINKIKYNSSSCLMLIKEIGKFKMLIDTGNFLKYSDEIPIIIINEKSYLKKVRVKKKYIASSFYEEIAIKTLNGYSKYKGYRYKEVYIKKRGDIDKKIDTALIIFTNEKIENDIFDGILPANIFIEK